MNKIELIFDNLKTDEGQIKATFQLKNLKNKIYELMQNDVDFRITIEEKK